MSGHDSSVNRIPSRNIALGLFAAVVGYLVAILGIVIYTWAGVHSLYRVPVLVIPVGGIVVLGIGGAMIWTERA